MYNEDEGIESVLKKNPAHSRISKSKRSPPQSPSPYDPFSDFRQKSLQQRINELTRQQDDTKRYIAEMSQDHICDSYIDQIKNDNVLLYRTNQELRIITKELLIKINDLENERKRLKSAKKRPFEENESNEFARQAQLHREILETDNNKSIINQLETENDDLKKQIRRLENANARFEAENDKLSELGRNSETLKKTVQDSSRELEVLRSQLQAEEKSRAELNGIIANLREIDRKKEEEFRRREEREMSIQTKLISAERQNERLSQDLQSYQNQIKSLNDQLSGLLGENRKQSSTIQDLQNTLTFKQQELNQYSDLGRDRENLNYQIRNLSTERDNYRIKFENSENDKRNLDRQLQTYQSKITSLESQINSLSSNAIISDQLKEVNKQNEFLRNEINNLNKSRQDLLEDKTKLSQILTDKDNQLRQANLNFEQERNRSLRLETERNNLINLQNARVTSQTVTQPQQTLTRSEADTKIQVRRIDSPGPRSRLQSRDDTATPIKTHVYTLDQLHQSSSMRNLEPATTLPASNLRQPSPSPITSSGQKIIRPSSNVFDTHQTIKIINEEYKSPSTIGSGNGNVFGTTTGFKSFGPSVKYEDAISDPARIVIENSELRARVQLLERENSEYKNEIENLNKKITNLNQELNRQRSRTPERNRFDVYSSDRVLDFQSTLNTMINKKEYEVQTVKGNANYLIAEIQSLQKENQQLRSRIREITEFNHSNVEEIKRLTNEINTLHSQIFALKTSH